MMIRTQVHAVNLDLLCYQLEELIKPRPKQTSLPSANILKLIHELRIHQDKLVIQNIVLQKINAWFQGLFVHAPSRTTPG